MAAIADLFDRLTNRVRDRELSAHDQLAAAAKRHVGGDNVDVGALEEWLYQTSQSVEDFRVLCEFEARRQKCFEELEQAPAAASKLAKIDAEITAANKKFSEARAAYESRLAKLHTDRGDVAPAVDAAARAKDWLLDPRNAVGALGQEYREALDAEIEAVSTVQRLERVIAEHRNDIKNIDSQIEGIRSDFDKTLSDRGLPSVRKKGEPTHRPLPQDAVAKIEEFELRKTRAQRRLDQAALDLDAARLMVPPAEARVAAVKKKLLTP